MMKSSKTPKISIIVPVYNISAYIERCVSSLLCQTFTSLEIIFIDDGSADDSVPKIRSLIKNKPKNKFLVRIIRQKNQGPSSARNAGIKIAQGDYLCFVDSDDAISPNFCEVTYQKAQASKADIIALTGYQACYQGCYVHRPRKSVSELTKQAEDKKERLKSIFLEHIAWAAWGKLYKKELFTRKLFAVGRDCEDLILIPEILLDAESIAFTCDANYFYYKRVGSITTTICIKKRFEDQNFGLKCNLALAKKYSLAWQDRISLFRHFCYREHIRDLGYLAICSAAKKFGSDFFLYFIIYKQYARWRKSKRKFLKKIFTLKYKNKTASGIDKNK